MWGPETYFCLIVTDVRGGNPIGRWEAIRQKGKGEPEYVEECYWQDLKLALPQGRTVF